MRNQNEERIVRRQTTWYVINIKARRDQNTAHYVRAFRSLQEEDPLVDLSRNRCESLKSVTFSEILDNDSEMSKMKHEVISGHEIRFPFSEKEMWANFNDSA